MVEKENKCTKFPSELRFDLASKDWVVIATGRSKRPEMFKKEKRIKETLPMAKCPFCNIETQDPPVDVFVMGKRVDFKVRNKVPKSWTAISIPNKYPAFLPSSELNSRVEGNIYETVNAVGFHEVLVTRNHQKQIPQFSLNQVKEVFDLYQSRYLDLMKKNFVHYVSIFHNHGVEAGASLSHPHSQIVTTPLIDVDLANALSRSKKYLAKNKKCVYCVMEAWEKKTKKRIVFENEEFLAICPFASKSAFEVIVTPKKHRSYFEKITEKEKWALSEAFLAVMKKLYKGLADPPYNFYLHTAPCDGNKYDHYHWHWTILPKTSTWAGFEIGTRMEISTIEPERAAAYLRKQ